MSAADPTDLTAHLSYWVRYVSIHVTHGLGVKFAGEGVTVAEWTVVRALYGVDAVAPGRLADRLGITHGAISKLADRLIEKRIVARREHHSDGRTHSLFLTPDGEALVPRLAAIADQHDADFFQGFTPEDRQTMERLLRGLVEHRQARLLPGAA